MQGRSGRYVWVIGKRKDRCLGAEQNFIEDRMDKQVPGV